MELRLAGPEPTVLVTCSLCLRVQRGRDWIDAEAVVRELRSYDLPAVPTLQPGLCDDCTAAISERRAKAEELIAA